MGENHLQVDSFEAGAQRIRNHYAKLTATLEQLDTDLRPMLASWSGAAQEAYTTSKDQWDTATQDLSQILNTVGQAVATAHENSGAAEQADRGNRST